MHWTYIIEKPEEGRSDIFISNAYDPTRNEHPRQDYSSNSKGHVQWKSLMYPVHNCHKFSRIPTVSTIRCSSTESDILATDLPLPDSEMHFYYE